MTQRMTSRLRGRVTSSAWLSATRLAFATLLLGAAAGCMSPPASGELWARCIRDYGLWQRYNYAGLMSSPGQKLRADYALYQCQLGRYHPAIEELEGTLHRMRMSVPN